MRRERRDLLQHMPVSQPGFLQSVPAGCPLHPSLGMGPYEGGGAQGKARRSEMWVWKQHGDALLGGGSCCDSPRTAGVSCWPPMLSSRTQQQAQGTPEQSCPLYPPVLCSSQLREIPSSQLRRVFGPVLMLKMRKKKNPIGSTWCAGTLRITEG